MRFAAYTHSRHVEPELMDDPALQADLHRVALRGLARINALSRSAAAIHRALAQLTAGGDNQPIRVLDVACGGGDVAVRIERMSRRRGVPMRVDGWDISATAIDQARRCAQRHASNARFFRNDALRDPLPAGYDAIVSNLFLHHLSREQAEELLSRMAEASGAVVINDLSRSPLGYASACVGTRLLSRSRIVHTDGPRSVRAAFTPEEARGLAGRAGLRGAKVVPHFPFRWLLTWSRR